MPIITTHVSVTNVAGGDVLALMAGASISSSLGDALTFSQSSVILWLGGTVWGTNSGVAGVASGAASEFNRITVASGANVFGLVAGVRLVDTGCVVSNRGTISGEDGISMTATAFDTGSSIVNDGDILGERFGIYQSLGTSASFSDLFVRNRGLIAGESGSLNSQDPDSFVTVINIGTMRGSIATSDGQDSITNRGIIEGDIFTADGDDTVKLIRGLAEGQVFLGGGNDLAELGAAGADVVDGGLGDDTVSFRNARGVTVNLTDIAQNAGAALGDIFFSVENVIGSSFNNDRLTGDGLANLLEGLGGNDSLAGGGGRDTLVGGVGTDTLTGGAGTDCFRFHYTQLGGDIVTDFSGTGATRDFIQFEADLLGGILTAGGLSPSQFVARADNQAQDADDVFIFRTTDQTLWYDHDGNGAFSAPQMVADFGPAVVLTAADIDIM